MRLLGLRRVGYNCNKYFALEGEANFFPETHLGNNQLGSKAQGFVGIKAGGRSKYAGLFGKVRPGAMAIGEITSGFDCTRTSFSSVCEVNHGHLVCSRGHSARDVVLISGFR